MSIVKNVVILFFGIIALSAINVDGFPDGAPVDVCVKSTPNRPHHGDNEPQAPNTNPYQVTASSGQYAPGTQITVKIQGSPFKGFFIQARDRNSDAWIGNFVKTPNTKLHDECSAITHADPRDKMEATLTWNAPATTEGQVYFTGSIVKNYATFWVDVVASTP